MSERVKGANTVEEWMDLRATIERSWTPVRAIFPRCNLTFGPVIKVTEDFLDIDDFPGRYFIDVDCSPENIPTVARVLFENADAAFHFKMFCSEAA